MSFYEINDKDVAGVINYLKIFHPEKPATPEYARALLQHYKDGYHQLSINDPAGLDNLLEDYEASKSKES